MTLESFDVVFGNPPYQKESNGSTRDVPIYQNFIELSEKIADRACLVTPARWMTSGLGLTDFRQSILSKKTISKIVVYSQSKNVFPSVRLMGGVNVILLDNTYHEKSLLTVVEPESVSNSWRQLDEFDVFIKNTIAVNILKKVLSLKEKSIVSILSVDKEFGFSSNYRMFCKVVGNESVPIYYVDGIRKSSYIDRDRILKSFSLVDTWKVLVPEASNVNNNRILGETLIVGPPSVCTQTFLFFHTDSYEEAVNIEKYLKTKFFRFLVSLRKATQHTPRKSYLWVPLQNFNEIWTDEKLYSKYALNKDEKNFIETHIDSY